MIDWKPPKDKSNERSAKVDRFIVIVCIVLLAAWIGYAYYKDTTLWGIL